MNAKIANRYLNRKKGIAVSFALMVLWPVHPFKRVQNVANKFGKLFGDHPGGLSTLP
jgi:hypothetical protein